mgnify:CR=1 FL=1
MLFRSFPQPVADKDATTSEKDRSKLFIFILWSRLALSIRENSRSRDLNYRFKKKIIRKTEISKIRIHAGIFCHEPYLLANSPEGMLLRIANFSFAHRELG